MLRTLDDVELREVKHVLALHHLRQAWIWSWHLRVKPGLLYEKHGLVLFHFFTRI